MLQANHLNRNHLEVLYMDTDISDRRDSSPSRYICIFHFLVIYRLFIYIIAELQIRSQHIGQARYLSIHSIQKTVKPPCYWYHINAQKSYLALPSYLAQVIYIYTSLKLLRGFSRPTSLMCDFVGILTFIKVSGD